METQNLEQQNSWKDKSLIFIIIVLATALFTGIVVYLWQQLAITKIKSEMKNQQLELKEQIEQLEKERQETRNRMMELYSKLPAESERHGWVWLFLRKEISHSSSD